MAWFIIGATETESVIGISTGTELVNRPCPVLSCGAALFKLYEHTDHAKDAVETGDQVGVEYPSNEAEG